MLEIYFLGTSAGIPSVERSMPCIALKWKGEVILWDVGECCQRKLMEYKVGYGSIRHVFISHLHLDHFLGIFGLIETLRMTTDVGEKGLNIYAPPRFKELLINKWKFLNIKRLRQGVVFRGDDFDITAFRVKHRTNAYGFVFQQHDRLKFYEKKAKRLGLKGKMFTEIQKKGKLNVKGRVVKLEDVTYVKKGIKVVYTGDTEYSDNVIKYAKGADVLIHEATFEEGKEEDAKKKSHSTVKDAALVAEKSGVKMLVLTHISARYKENSELFFEQARKYFSGNVVVAYDGLKITL